MTLTHPFTAAYKPVTTGGSGGPTRRPKPAESAGAMESARKFALMNTLAWQRDENMHAAARLKMDANMTCTVRQFYDNIGTFNLIFRSQTTVSSRARAHPRILAARLYRMGSRPYPVRSRPVRCPRRVRGLGSAAGRYPYKRRRREAGAGGRDRPLDGVGRPVSSRFNSLGGPKTFGLVPTGSPGAWGVSWG